MIEFFKTLLKRSEFLPIVMAAFLSSQNQIAAQEFANTISFTRGALWHAFNLAQECEPMADWQRKTYGLDWPGYRTDEVKQDIGGSYSYLVAGGFFITALTDTGSVWGCDNFATHGTTVGTAGAEFRYLISRDENDELIHRRKFSNGENYWLLTDPREAEDVIVTQWEINGEWFQPWDNQNIPVKVRRTARQWSGSKADENYIITEYSIKNTQRRNDLKGVYLLFTWAVGPTHRGWNLTFPNLPAGARNTHSSYDPQNRQVVCWAGDYTDTPGVNESFDYFEHLEYDPVENRNVIRPEFLAPGYTGIKFLYISPDSLGRENTINGFAWSAASPSQDHSGPFLGVAGLDNKYDAMANPLLLSEAFQNPDDPRMGQNRLYVNFSLGPFNLARREADSVKVVVAEFVGGMRYEEAFGGGATAQTVKQRGDSAVAYLSDRIRFNYDHNYTVPMPPPGPSFTIRTNETSVGNIIEFDNSIESINDPHQGTPDVVGYHIYRSGRYSFGPWEKIATLPVRDSRYYSPEEQKYVYLDARVALGYGYYYSVTSFDSGQDSWAINSAVSVPSLESSIYANRKSAPFYTRLLATDKLDEVTVVPNPFYRSSGFALAGDLKRIQFEGLPARCTIRIYTLRGDLIKTIEHQDSESGIASWNQISENGLYVKSGMYFYVVTSSEGETVKGKFAIIN
ncbi:MAG: hypothetical protein EH225_02170 [Calditrichaeota bacterium]|nr:hypothetical protein [Calditrichota bacterium]RQW07279.1 MAG: hypothetical protein EH225_02170 [Calditrichota bacterium]